MGTPTKLITILAPPSPTTSALNAKAAGFAQQGNMLWTQLAAYFVSLADFIYNNPNGTQAAFDAFGTSAGDLFTMGAAYTAMVQAYTGVAPASPVPPGASVTVNADGTVTYTPPTTTGN